MKIISDKKKCMASLAVFKQLFNSGNDIFSIISEFIKQEIISKGLTNFTEQQMHDLLLADNGFDVPQAVIHTAMKRIPFLICKKEGAIVSEELTNDICSYFKTQMNEAERIRESISNRLIAFANIKRDKSLTKDEEVELCKSFYAYVVDDEAPVRFAELACSFILENEQDTELQRHLNLIREGAISFVGLTYYNTSYGTVDAFDNDIYIYLETEILFHMAGYNGLTYKNLFDEFYNQVSEINKLNQIKKGKKIIHLRYFSETLKEIDDYFEQAEKIVRRSKLSDPSKAAMHSIINGVSEPSDIADKRAEFDRLLKEHNIQHEDFWFDLNRSNGKYCIDYEAFVKDGNPSLIDKIYSDLTLLNWIYIKRNRKPIEQFANIRAVLLTGNFNVMRMAMDEKLRKPKELALSATIDFLTTRFWFSLCRGLSADCNLLTAKVMTRARLALAALNCESIDKAYQEIRKNLNENNYDPERMKSRITCLHKRFRMPEDVDDLTEKGNLAFFTDCRTDILLSEEAAKETANKNKIEALSTCIEDKDRTIEKQNGMFMNLLNDRLKEINEKEKQEYNKKIYLYRKSKKKWIKRQMNNYLKSKLLYLVSFILLLLAMIIVPLVIESIPNNYSWIGLIVSAILAVLNRISSLSNTEFFKSKDILFKSKRMEKLLEYNKEYLKNHIRPTLIMTTIEELKNRYESSIDNK